MHVLFTEDGEMDKRVFLATWKDIPVQNEVQYEITNVQHNAGLFANGYLCLQSTLDILKFTDRWLNFKTFDITIIAADQDCQSER